MTIQESHTFFRFYFDELDTNSLGDISKEGIDLAINGAFEDYIKNKYRAVEGLAFRSVGFEEIQKRIDDLRVLVKSSVVTLTPDNDYPDLYKADLDSILSNEGESEYQFYLRGQVEIKQDVYKGIKIDKQDNIDIISDDPFNQSNIQRPRGYFEGSNLVIIKPKGLDESFNLSKLRITYLRRFKEVSLDDGIGIELPPHTHREIVTLAVNQMLEVHESQRVQTNIQKVASSE